MKITKSQLKQLIQEELNTLKEAGYTHPDHPGAEVDPDTFIYAEEMKTIVQNLQGLRRDIGWELNNNRNLREEYGPSAGPLTGWAQDLIRDVESAITKREDKIKAALSNLVGKIATSTNNPGG